MGFYAILDRAPKGRNEGEQPMGWLRRHDEYKNRVARIGSSTGAYAGLLRRTTDKGSVLPPMPSLALRAKLVTIATSRRSVVHMTRNMGTFDRGLRAFVIAPVAIVVAFFVGAGTVFGVILFVIAGVMLATAVTAFCPTYTLIGISTRPTLHRVRPHVHAGHA